MLIDREPTHLNKEEEKKRQEAKKEEMKEFVDSFSSKKGAAKRKEVAKWVGTGMFMGASDAIPGYSGGTTLALIGFFKKLVIVSRCVFIPAYGISRTRALIFMLPFVIGWMAGVFGIAKTAETLAHHSMGLELMFFFSAFVIAAIPIYLRSIKPKPNSHKRVLPRWKKILLAVTGFVIIITIALIVLLVKGGANIEEEGPGSGKFDLSGWWALALVAFGAGAVTLIPGGSGALIQLLSGKYEDIHFKIMANVTHNIPALFIFAIFTFLGMLTMIFIMSWFLAKRERMLEMFSLGMLIASPAAILIVPSSNMWEHMKHWPHILGVILAAGLGYGLGFTISHFTKKSALRKQQAAANA